jgi:serine/threonine-protein kinase
MMLTAPDATAGTPAYIAPEMVRGDSVIDHRVDIYALGCVAYWLLTGHLVFEAPNAIQLMIAHSQTPPVPPSERIELEIPPAFDAVVLACLAKRADDRPANAAELSRRLAAAVSGEGWTEDKAQRWWNRHHPWCRSGSRPMARWPAVPPAPPPSSQPSAAPAPASF